MRYLTVLVTLLLAVQGVKADNVAQAIWCENNKTLYFDYHSGTSTGSTYDSQTVTAVYNVDLSTVYTGSPAWNNETDVDTKATKVVFKESFKQVTPQSCQYWFYNFKNLREIEGLENLNTSQVKDMDFMFDGCELLVTLNVSNFDVTKVLSAASVFKECSNLKTIYCNKEWNFSNSVITSSMFDNCTSLKGGIAYDNNKVTGDYATPKSTGYFTASLGEITENDLTKYDDYYGDFTFKLSEGTYTLYKDGHWNTMCLPFSISNIAGTVFAGATVRALSSSSFANGELNMRFADATTAIEAGVPYIVKWETTSATNLTTPLEFKGVTILNSVNNTNTTCVNFCGNFSSGLSLGAQSSIYLYLGSDDKLYFPSDAAVPIGIYHAYFELNLGSQTQAKIRNIVMNYDDDDEGTATDITSLSVDAQGIKDTATWYTLDGRRLSGKPTQKGIYMNNGKKFMIK